MIPLLTAILGAFAAGGLQFLLRRTDQAHERRVIIAALSTEVRLLCNYIRLRDYIGVYTRQALEFEKGLKESLAPIAVSQNYFTIYDAVASKTGLLPLNLSELFVEFYMMAKVAVDTARPEGPYRNINNAKFMKSVAERLLEIGDKILNTQKGKSSVG